MSRNGGPPVIVSRGSQLALWQARWISGQLPGSRIEIVKTTGDRITDAPLPQIGGKGLFTKEIEEALLDGRGDVAVHSLKDLPTALPPGLVLAATPVREDARDAILGMKLADLPRGARVGTSSPRRAAQLRAVRPDLVIDSLRGNLDTRLRKLAEGQYGAIVLALAGLKRMGWTDRVAEVLDPEIMCPAVGQGALGIETREDGRRLVAFLDHAPTRAAVAAERAMLEALGGGCQLPMGAYARLEGDRLRVLGMVASPDGSRVVRAEVSGSAADAEAAGRELAARLTRDS
ncbi:MAG: hydroxymethylbilane synthase [Bryobacteraceae bacterium]